MYEPKDSADDARDRVRHELIVRLGLAEQIAANMLVALPAGVPLSLSAEQCERCATVLDEIGIECEVIAGDVAGALAFPLFDHPDLIRVLGLVATGEIGQNPLRPPNETVDMLERMLDEALSGALEESLVDPPPADRSSVPTAGNPSNQPSLGLAIEKDPADAPARDVYALSLDAELPAEESREPVRNVITPQATFGAGLSFDDADDDAFENASSSVQTPTIAATQAPTLSTDDAPPGAELSAGETHAATETASEQSAPSPSEDILKSAFAARPRPASSDQDPSDEVNSEEDESTFDDSADETTGPPDRRLRRAHLVAAAVTIALLGVVGFYSIGLDDRASLTLTDEALDKFLKDQKRILQPREQPTIARVVERRYRGSSYIAPFHAEITVEQSEGKIDSATVKVWSDEAEKRTLLEIAHKKMPRVTLRELTTGSLEITPPWEASEVASPLIRGEAKAYFVDELRNGRARALIELSLRSHGSSLIARWTVRNVEAPPGGSDYLLERTGPTAYKLWAAGETMLSPEAPAPTSPEGPSGRGAAASMPGARERSETRPASIDDADAAPPPGS